MAIVQQKNRGDRSRWRKTHATNHEKLRASRAASDAGETFSVTVDDHGPDGTGYPASVRVEMTREEAAELHRVLGYLLSLNH